MGESKKPLLPSTKEEINIMQFNSAPKMVKVGKLYGCTLWAEMDPGRNPKDHWRIYLLIMETLKKAFGVPDEKN